ncbi:MAG: TIR domain-containing protein [Pseudomonadota bacterium]
MPYEVFFSYRRADYGAPMRELFTDLAEKVRTLRGLDRHEELVFFDQESIETGDNWDARLLQALQEAKVLVPLYSPAYFKSEYCAREWAAFHLRRLAYAKSTGMEPPVIKPLVWIPIRQAGKLALPEGVSEAVKLVSDAELEFDSDQVELTRDLTGAVRQALKEGKIVVVFVDRWSLFDNEDYRNIFREFDQENFYNCAVLLPWNPHDPELAACRQDIEQTIADVLHFHCQYAPTSPYACRDMGSVEELRQTLQAVLTQIQAEMRRQAPVGRPVGAPFARPVVAGPGGNP